MRKRQIGVDVLVKDYFWHQVQERYVYSFDCPACRQTRVVTELGIVQCDCGSWLIVNNER
jgi:hypothetical protein